MDKTEELEIHYKDYLDTLYGKALTKFREVFIDSEDFEEALNAFNLEYDTNFLLDEAKEKHNQYLLNAASIGIESAFNDLGIDQIESNLITIENADVLSFLLLNINSFEESKQKANEDLTNGYQDRENYKPTDDMPIWLDGVIGSVGGYFAGKAVQVAANSIFNSERYGVTKFVNSYSSSIFKVDELDENGNKTGFVLSQPNVIRITRGDERVRELHARYNKLVTTLDVFVLINEIDGFGCRCRMKLTAQKANIVSVQNMKVKNFYQATSSDIVERQGQKVIKLVMRTIVGNSAMKGYYYPKEVIEEYNNNSNAEDVQIDLNHNNQDVGSSTDKYINGDSLVFESFVNVSDLVGSDLGLDVLVKLNNGEGYETGVSFEGDIVVHPVPEAYDEYGNKYNYVVDSLTIDRISILFNEDPAGLYQGTRIINSANKAEEMEKAELEAKVAELEAENKTLSVKVQNFEDKEAKELALKIKNAAEKTGFDTSFFDGMDSAKIDQIVAKVSNSQDEEENQDPKKKKVQNSADDQDLDTVELPSRYTVKK